MERRKFLKVAGGATAGVALAGCLGQEQGSGGGGEPTNDGDDEVAEGGQDQDSWFNLTGEIANDTNEQLRFTRVDLAQIAGGDSNAGGNSENDSDVFGSGDPVAAVTGAVKNTAEQSFEEVEVTATLYDQNDPIGQYFDKTESREIDSLRPGQKWQFTIVFEDADVDKATRYTIKADGDLADKGTADDGDGNTTESETPTPTFSGNTTSS